MGKNTLALDCSVKLYSRDVGVSQTLTTLVKAPRRIRRNHGLVGDETLYLGIFGFRRCLVLGGWDYSVQIFGKTSLFTTVMHSLIVSPRQNGLLRGSSEPLANGLRFDV